MKPDSLRVFCERLIPACYYEFARRYTLPGGKLFRGFVEGSADKIFESTDKGQDFKKTK